MKNKKEDELKKRTGLTLLLSSLVFVTLLISIMASSLILYILVRVGIVHMNSEGGAMELARVVILLMVIMSTVIGGFLAYLNGRGVIKPISVVISAMNRLARGDFKTRIGFSGFVSKIPSVKELTDSFNKMAENLEGTELLRSDFINDFSHEFKTPIVSISGFAKLLRHGDLSDEEKDEYLKIIEEESIRLSKLSTNILNLSKVENQTILTDVTRFNISETLRQSILELETKWEDKNLDLDVDFDECYYEGNQELLRQVWINLIDNAVKFTPSGGNIRISIDNQKEECLVVNFMNSGITISKDVQEKMFDKFYQGDSSHSTQGNGIGLAAVKKIVELHEGTISVSSENDITVISVSLPKKIVKKSKRKEKNSDRKKD